MYGCSFCFSFFLFLSFLREELIIGGSCHKCNFCRDKTRRLSRHKYACRAKQRKKYAIILSRQKTCYVFVATKIILVAPPANDRSERVPVTVSCNGICLFLWFRVCCITLCANNLSDIIYYYMVSHSIAGYATEWQPWHQCGKCEKQIN